MLFKPRDAIWWMLAGQPGIAVEVLLVVADKELNGE